MTIMEQLAHIGSEVSRASKWQGRDEKIFQGATERALELFDLTLSDLRWQKTGRLREIARVRELFCQAVTGGENEYKTSLEDLNNYFFPFSFAVRKDI